MDIIIAGKNIKIKEYQGQRVVAFKDVDLLHERPDGTASRNYRDNRTNFVVGEDFFEINQPDEIRRLGIIRPQGGTPEKVILLTESGYLLLVKSLKDALAWKIQKLLIHSYFKIKEQKQEIPQMSELEILAHATQSLVNHEKELKRIAQQQDIINHRLDNLDACNIQGDLKQRLNSMVRKFAYDTGITYSAAWKSFQQAFNLAFHTNITVLKNNYIEKHSLKTLTVPQYLSIAGKLEDAIRVVDKMLFQSTHLQVVKRTAELE